MYYIEDKDLNNMAIDTYSQIKDNNYIPEEIRESWRDFCITTTDISNLCNF